MRLWELWVVVLVITLGTVRAVIPPCNQSISSVLGVGQGDINPLGVAVPLADLVGWEDFDRLDRSGRKGVFFLEREDFLDNEIFLRKNIVSRGHHVGLSFLRKKDEMELKYDAEVVKLITSEQGFAESVTGKRPIFLLAPASGVSETLMNASRSIGTFVLDWGTIDNIADLRTHQFERTVQVEKVMDSEQIHCAFDRTSCDFVGQRELYHHQCLSFRLAYHEREGLDLFKFVSKRLQRLPQREFAAQIKEESVLKETGKSFLEVNRLRVQKAYEQVDAGAHLRDIMVVLFSLTDDQISNDFEKSLLAETHDYWSVILKPILFFAILLLALYVFLFVRGVIADRENNPRRGQSKSVGILGALSEFSKAE